MDLNDRALRMTLSSGADIEALPFGVVLLDASLCVRAYNTAEQQLSGLSAEAVMGRPFFSDVALCMNNYMVADRFRAPDPQDDEFDYVLSVRMRPTPVRIRVIHDPDNDLRALCIERASKP